MDDNAADFGNFLSLRVLMVLIMMLMFTFPLVNAFKLQP